MGAPAADSSEIEEEDGRPSVEAEGIIPEPDVGPCKNCTVDVAGRVRGGFQTISACPTTGAPVVYPVKDPRVEITAGAQEGLHFSVDVGVSTFNEGQGLIGAMAEGAIPDGWVEAKLWVTDANGKVCASSLAILH